MGCCGNKKCNLPKKEMMNSEVLFSLLNDSSLVVTKLLEIAKNGIRSVGFKNEKISELAAAISAIVAENNYLKSLLGHDLLNKPKTDNNGATIFFGPRGEYSFFIAAPTQETRDKLAENLITAGKELQQKKTTEPNVKQQVFSFYI